MMKATVVRVSLLAALVPLASACANADPGTGVPAEAVLLGPIAGPSSSAPEAVAVQRSASARAYIFPRNATLFGDSYEGWAAAWWQWLLAIPKDINPNLDAPCDVDQSGQVFFLGGNFGGTSTRSCTMPEGKAIFFPIVNVLVSSCPEYADDVYTCETAMSEDALHEDATWVMDQDKSMTLVIDGVAIDDLGEYRAQTDTFLDTAPPAWDDRFWPDCTGPIRENACGVPVGSARNTVSDGHWIMLRPLSPGNHQIHFGASVPDFGFSLDITYNIVVAP